MLFLHDQLGASSSVLTFLDITSGLRQCLVDSLTEFRQVSWSKWPEVVLASLLGSALDPLDPDAFPRPNCVAAYNMMAMIISCATLFGSCVMVLETVICESTPTERIHSIIARADGIFGFAINMVACGLQGLAPLIVVRAWASGLDDVQCTVLTAVVALLYMTMMDTFFDHYMKVSPFQVQLRE